MQAIHWSVLGVVLVLLVLLVLATLQTLIWASPNQNHSLHPCMIFILLIVDEDHLTFHFDEHLKITSECIFTMLMVLKKFSHHSQ